MNQTQVPPSVIRFFKIAHAEGVSFLLLVFLAMPLKYWANMPMAVRYTGWAHGLLFILFVASLLKVGFEQKWRFLDLFAAFVSGLLPFGTFAFSKYYYPRVILK